jgi:hypothetical protein
MNGPPRRDTNISLVGTRPRLARIRSVGQKAEILGKVTRVIRRRNWHRSRAMAMRIVGEGLYSRSAFCTVSGIGRGRDACLCSSCSLGQEPIGLPDTGPSVFCPGRTSNLGCGKEGCRQGRSLRGHLASRLTSMSRRLFCSVPIQCLAPARSRRANRLAGRSPCGANYPSGENRRGDEYAGRV